MEEILVSYSSLNTFASCSRKFEFDKLYPRLPRDGSWYAADTGSALHAGYQDYLIHKDVDRATWIFMQAFPYMGEFEQTNDYRSFEACLATLEAMIAEVRMNEYELAQIKTPSGEVKPAIEVPFKIRFPDFTVSPCTRYPEGATISFIGYIDAIMQNLMTNVYRTLDIKTTRMMLNDATAKFQFDTQQIPYGIVVDHVAQDVVESFEVLYLDCYIDLLEPKTQVYPFMKTQQDIQEWGTNKMIQLGQLRNFIESDFFPRTDSGCLFYNKPCRYLDCCSSRDSKALEHWFLMGMEPETPEPFEPWIIADISTGGGNAAA